MGTPLIVWQRLLVPGIREGRGLCKDQRQDGSAWVVSSKQLAEPLEMGMNSRTSYPAGEDLSHAGLTGRQSLINGQPGLVGPGSQPRA